jgi:hypothetical protein
MILQAAFAVDKWNVPRQTPEHILESNIACRLLRGPKLGLDRADAETYRI